MDHRHRRDQCQQQATVRRLTSGHPSLLKSADMMRLFLWAPQSRSLCQYFCSSSTHIQQPRSWGMVQSWSSWMIEEKREINDQIRQDGKVAGFCSNSKRKPKHPDLPIMLTSYWCPRGQRLNSTEAAHTQAFLEYGCKVMKLNDSHSECPSKDDSFVAFHCSDATPS